MTPFFIDGFDWGTAINIVPTSTSTLQKWVNYSSGGSGSIQPGRVSSASQGGGNCLRMESAGFRQATMSTILTASPAFISCGFAHRNIGGATGQYTLFRFEAGSPTVVDPGAFDDGTNPSAVLTLIQETDGTVNVYNGAGGTPNFPGALLATLVTNLTRNTWRYIEVTANPATGDWAVYIDDVLDTAGNTALTGLDRYSFQNFGFESHELDDHYAASERLGPCRVTGLPPDQNGLNQWAPLTPGPNLAMIGEFGNRASATPDADVTYVESSSAGQTDLFSWSKPACYGRILALAINADAKTTAGSTSLDLILRFRGTTYPFGSTSAFGVGYSMAQICSERSLVSGAVWNDAEISGEQFGYSMAGIGTERVTQLYLEKLVSLRPVSYSCGEGSYSFTA